ncbi:MAG: PRC-barrel domain-containing protein [Planctomycetota bacterium]
MPAINQLRIPSLRGAAAAILLATTTTIGLTAQEGNESKPQKPDAIERTTMDYTTTSRLVGAKVFLEASAKETAEARRDGEQPDRPTAKVTEWLVDCRDGQLKQAVVSLGGFLGLGDKVVLVPAADLRWNNSMERYDLAWTKEELKGKPSFDLATACKNGLDAACGIHADKAGEGKGTAEASVARGKKVPGTDFVGCSQCMHKASDLSALPVYAGSTEWGKVQDLIVDRNKNCIVLAVVNHGSTLGMGGKDYLVAYPKVTACQKDGDAQVLCCASGMTAAQLESCVPFVKPKNGVVDPAAAKKALEGVEPKAKN